MGGAIRESLRQLANDCSLPAALEAMGERWSFLILRGSFNGLHHFEEFQSELGIARNILANRLARLVDKGILQRQPCADDRRKIEYRLTDKGYALLPVMISLRQWGERWETGVPAFPVLVDARDSRPIRQVQVLSHDGRVLGKGDLLWALAEDVVHEDEAAEVKAAEQGRLAGQAQLRHDCVAIEAGSVKAMALRGLGSTGLLCAGLLAGCTLGSDQPFIPRGDTVPGLADGDYQRFMIAGPAKMPAAIRRDCVTPGYVFPMPDERGKRRNRQVQPTYCPYDGAQRLPLIRLAREGDGYWLTAPDRRLNIRFKLLRHGIYLVQSDDPEGDGLRYGYALTREAPGGIDMALLNCDYFPALKSIHQTDTANAAEEVAIEPETAPAPEPSAAPGPREVLPSQHGDCRAPSLAAIQPELDRVVDRFAQGREIVWFLLRRVA